MLCGSAARPGFLDCCLHVNMSGFSSELSLLPSMSPPSLHKDRLRLWARFSSRAHACDSMHAGVGNGAYCPKRRVRRRSEACRHNCAQMYKVGWISWTERPCQQNAHLALLSFGQYSTVRTFNSMQVCHSLRVRRHIDFALRVKGGQGRQM